MSLGVDTHMSLGVTHMSLGVTHMSLGVTHMSLGVTHMSLGVDSHCDTHETLHQLDRKNPPPPGGFPIYYVP